MILTLDIIQNVVMVLRTFWCRITCAQYPL